jgi:hypothetical protein
MTAYALATIAACVLVFCAASFNAGHAYELASHHSQWRGIVLATASVAAAVLAPLALMAAKHGRGFGTRILALVLALGCVLYTSVSTLGFTATARDIAVVGHQAESDTYRDKRALAEAVRGELFTLKGTRADIVERRAELTAILVELSKAKPGNRPSAQRDSQAAGVAFVLRAAGWQVAESDVGQWLNIGMTLALELFAALSLTVATALRPMRPASAPAAVAPECPQVPSRDETAASDEKKRPADENDGDGPPPPRPRGKGGRPTTVLPAQALEKLRSAGAKANGVRGVAKVLGTSKSTAHRVLHQLANAGLVRLSTGPHGISVALA